MVSTYIFPGNSHNFALDSRRISLSGSGGDFCECTMVFAFVQTTEKTAFLGLKQSGFTQSGLLTTVQIFVHFVQFVQKLAFAGVHVVLGTGIFGSQWFLALLNLGRKCVWGLRQFAFDQSRLVAIVQPLSAIDQNLT